MKRYRKFNGAFKPKPDDIFKAILWMYIKKPEILRKMRNQIIGK